MYRASAIIFYIIEALLFIASVALEPHPRENPAARQQGMDGSCRESGGFRDMVVGHRARPVPGYRVLARTLHGLASADSDKVSGLPQWLYTRTTGNLTQLAIQRALAEKTDYRHEYRVIQQDGSMRWIAAQGRGCFDDAGKPLQLLGRIA